jgi:hypothetical protein
MHELTIFATFGDREPCVCASDVSNDASAVQSIPSFSPSVSVPVVRTYYGPRASEKPAPCTTDAGRKRRSVPERDAPISRAAEAAGRILCRPILVNCITNMLG